MGSGSDLLHQETLGGDCAVLSACETYRYSLSRVIGGSGGTICFLMLNPSTADAFVNDRTVAKCMQYARRWNHSHLCVVNLFALRSTDPRNLYKHNDPVGPWNDDCISMAVADSEKTVLAWGNHGEFQERANHILQMIALRNKPMFCFGKNKNGTPKHPLYQPSDIELIQY